MCSTANTLPQDPRQWLATLSRIVEKLDTLSRLSPILSSDQEAALTLSVLIDIIHDYVEQLRFVLAKITAEGQEEEPHE